MRPLPATFLVALTVLTVSAACDKDGEGASSAQAQTKNAHGQCATGRACGPGTASTPPAKPAKVSQSASSMSLPTAAASASEPPAAEHYPDYVRSRPLMGTIFRITVTDTPPERAGPAVDAALNEIARLEKILSEWRPDSDISKINDAAGEHPVKVSDDALAVVKAGLAVSRWSHGAFDLSWAALRGLYDFNSDHPTVPTRAEIRKRLPFIDWHDIVVNDAKHTVFLKRKGMAIGTGGIGKGYALDRAGKILQKAGIESYMLFGGGQVQVHGMRGNRPWRVGIEHPRQNSQYFAFLEATGGSISTSGDYEHYFFGPNGKRWHHILNPRTGLPARGALSVTVRAATGLYADALSTAAFVLGAKGALHMFATMPYEAEMIMVDGHCRLVTTPGTDAHLHLTEELGPDRRLPNCKP